ncbi:hypothetical protein N8083_00220 [Candidatus Pacebacteria bacterium]|nr:hypothetical protein [Candidatus Paceibacterota bacterium]
MEKLTIHNLWCIIWVDFRPFQLEVTIMAKFAIKSVSEPTISRVRPVNIMFDEDITTLEAEAVMNGLTKVMNAANAPQHMPINNFGVWRNSDWLEEGSLTQWNSVDWYLAYTEHHHGRNGQLRGGKLLQLLYSEPWQEAEAHYDIMVTSRDLYDDDCHFCIGLAIHGFGTVISTARFRGLDQRTTVECVVTETMHEAGHVFGLVPETRTSNVEHSLGLHCTNRCIMRQGLQVPHWQTITADRLAGHEFCEECRHDLQRYFQQ